DGADVIEEEGVGGVDTIQFGEGILPEHVRVFRSSNQDQYLVLELDTGERISILLKTSSTHGWSGGNAIYRDRIVEAVKFTDGTVWSHQELLQMAYTGTSANDYIAAFNTAAHLIGGAGDDSLYGGQGSDTLHGGSGNDYLGGGQGSDTYLVNRGDDNTSIYDSYGYGDR